MYFLGIDIGSTFLKCALLSAKDHSVSFVRSVPSPQRIPSKDPQYFVYDAGQFVRIIKMLIAEAIAVCGGDIGVVMSTQMHGFVAEEKYFSWQDSRCLDSMNGGVSYLEYMKSVVSQAEMRSCGVYFKPSLGVCNLFAKLHAERRSGDGLEVFTLGSYILHNLCGENCCHITNAAPFGFADIERMEWRGDLFAKFGLSGLLLPRIVHDDYAPCGRCIVSNVTVTFYPDYGDQQVSVLGSGAERDEAIINIATASQIIAPSDRPEYGDYEVRPYFDGAYIKVLSNMPGGRGLQVFVDFVKDIARKICRRDADDETVFSYICSLPIVDTRHLTVDMSFYPTYDKFDGGSVSHITPVNFTMDTLFSAAYEAMSAAYRDGFRCLQCEAPKSIVCIGGVAQKNTSLRTAIENALRCPCRLPEEADEVLKGLLHIAEKIAISQGKE